MGCSSGTAGVTSWLDARLGGKARPVCNLGRMDFPRFKLLGSPLHDYARREKGRAFALAIRLHALALTISGVAIAAGVLGAYGALP